MSEPLSKMGRNPNVATNDDTMSVPVATAIGALDEYVHKLAPEIDPRTSKFFLGTYHAEVQKRTVSSDDERDDFTPRIITQGNAAYPYRFFVRKQKTPIPIVWREDKSDHESAWHLDRTFKPSLQSATSIHLANWTNLTDIAKDPLSEMEIAGFPYAKLVSDMSPSARSSFAKNLADIELPIFVADKDSEAFLRWLAHNATYDARGDYFPKWNSEREVGQQPWEQHVSQSYLSASFEELTLERGYFYVLQTSTVGVRLFRLAWGDSLTRTLSYEALHSQSPSVKAPVGKSAHMVTLIYAADGLGHAWKERTRKVWRLRTNVTDVSDEMSGKAVRTNSRIIDVQKMVEAVAGKTAGKDLAIQTKDDWLHALIELYFPSRFHLFNLRTLDTNDGTVDKHGKPTRPPLTQQQLMIQTVGTRARTELRKVLAEEAGMRRGVVTDAARGEVDEFLGGNDDTIVLPQGYETGAHSLFVGFDDMYAYDFHRDTGNVARMPIGDYLFALAEGDLANLVWESNKWLIKFIEYEMLAIAVAVSGGYAIAATGEALSLATVRTMVTTWAREKVTREAAKQAILRATPLFVSQLARLAAYLIARDPVIVNGPALGLPLAAKIGTYAGRLAAFGEGFLSGYLKDAIVTHFLDDVIADTAMNGPREIREVRAVWRLAEGAKKVKTIVDTLEREMDDAAVKVASELFATAAAGIARGAALLLSSVYHVPHDEAQPLLSAIGVREDGKPPDPATWGFEAHVQIRKAADYFSSQVKDNLGSIQSITSTLSDPKVVSAMMLLAVFEPQIVLGAENAVLPWIHKAFGNKEFKAFFYIGFIPILIAVGFAVAPEKMHFLLVDSLGGLLGNSNEEAKFNGNLVGAVFGGFFVKSTLFGKGTPIGKLMEGDHDTGEGRNIAAGGFLWGNLKNGVIGAVLKVVFHRYVWAYNQLQERGGPIAAKLKRRRITFLRELMLLGQERLEEQGFGHLAAFTTEKGRIPLGDIALAIFRLRDLVISDLDELLRESFGNDIKKYSAELESFNDVLETQGYDFHKLPTEHLTMAFHTFGRQLLLALDELAKALSALFKPFTKNQLSWITLFQQLGLDVGDIKDIVEEVIARSKNDRPLLKSP